MTWKKTKKVFVILFAVAWAITFTMSFVLGGIGFFIGSDDVSTMSVFKVFLSGHILAGMFAVAAAAVAAITPSMSIRKFATVPLAGTGLVALGTLSLGGFIVVLG